MLGITGRDRLRQRQSEAGSVVCLLLALELLAMTVRDSMRRLWPRRRRLRQITRTAQSEAAAAPDGPPVDRRPAHVQTTSTRPNVQRASSRCSVGRRLPGESSNSQSSVSLPGLKRTTHPSGQFSRPSTGRSVSAAGPACSCVSPCCAEPVPSAGQLQHLTPALPQSEVCVYLATGRRSGAHKAGSAPV